MGRKMHGQNLFCVDGFAGPGHYTNYSEGSPTAALKVARDVISTGHETWRAGVVHFIFIERDGERFAHLESAIAPHRNLSTILVHTSNTTFVEGFTELQGHIRQLTTNPLFVFIDPFGATGVPFSIVTGILANPKGEVLINLDADGIARIVNAAHIPGNAVILDELFGDDSWKAVLCQPMAFPEQCRRVLDLYRSKLCALPAVKYTFPFEMRSQTGTLQYFLLFASQHHLGLEKMKEAMKRIDQSGAYCFSDAHIQQDRLFRFDEPADYSRQMFDHFRSQPVPYSTVRDYALNETPFTNPKGMLKELEQRNRIDVLSPDPPRRRGTFPDEKTDQIHIHFHEAWDSPSDDTPTQLSLW